MNYTIKEEATSGRLPEVGELWRHLGDDSVYMRIADYSGLRALKGFAEDVAKFYSVNIEDGDATWTPLTATGIILLQPVGGTLELEVKR